MKAFLRFLLLIAPFLYMMLIFILSSLPADAIVNTPYSWDSAFKESLHLIEFGILYGLWVLFFLVRGTFTAKTSTLAAILSIAYGFSDELHQYFVPYRSATVIDLVKDTIGVIVLFYIVKISYFGEKLPRFKKLLLWVERLNSKKAEGN
ncbi:VanZ family protein [Bacillus sinesaloumensis]|uniref:VanZ family protein n=1 Tax=Litchfieldia sinesaloumensis TaxID=1926280 RepID=UPI0009884331|nr:VanZ family protein [Bacillus sinesaloumensis]